MKKIIISCCVVYVLLQNISSYGSTDIQNSSTTVYGQIDNQTMIPWTHSLAFSPSSNNVSAFAETDISGPFYIEATNGTTGDFYLSYQVTLNSGKFKNQKQCKFDVTTTDEGNMTITETPMPNAYISCVLTGNQADKNLVLHLSFDSNYLNHNLN